MKKILLTLLWGTCFFVVQAQEELLKLQAETRIDYQCEYVDGRSIHSNSGFKGKYLNVIISGTIAKQFSYSYRQRLNKAHSDPVRKKCIFSRKKFVQPVRSVLVRICTENSSKLKRAIVHISNFRTPYEPYRLFEVRTRFFQMRTEQSSSHCANLIVTLPQETFPLGEPTTLCRPQG